MGLTWAGGWAGAGILIGVASNLTPGLPWDSFFEVFDAPLPALAIPGFIGGVLFSIVVGIAGRRRQFEELSLPRFAAWGAAGGLLLSLVPAALVGLGIANPESEGGIPIRYLTAVISGPLIFLSAVSASASLVLARMKRGRRWVERSPDLGKVGLTKSEAQELLLGRDHSPHAKEINQ